MDGEEWIQKHLQTSTSLDDHAPTTRKWRDEDYFFYQLVITHSQNCKGALIGNADASSPHHNFDFDGSNFLNELLEIIHAGNAYLKASESVSIEADKQKMTPIEPMQLALSVTRDLLSLVGFSNKTIRPEKSSAFELGDQGEIGDEYRKHTHEREKELVNVAVKMRGNFRDLALKSLNSDDNDNLRNSIKNIIHTCDEMRDVSFPSLGVEIFDEKIQEADDMEGRWRWCTPKSKEDLMLQSHTSSPKIKGNQNAIVVESVDAKDYFRVGQYKDMFSDYDETGLPLKNADDGDLSKSLRKKLEKKRKRFFDKGSKK